MTVKVTPMDNKTPEVKAYIEAVFPGTAKAIEEEKCPCCKESTGHFRDHLSEREYNISGLCQKCQDYVFGP